MTTERSPHLDPDWLRRKYVDEGLSTYDIARIVSRDPKRIHEKLRDFGIPTRPRGHNLHGADNSWALGYANAMEGRKHTAEARSKIAKSARRPRPWLRGDANGMHGVSGTASPTWRGGISPERQRIYASGAWRAVKRAVTERDSGKCQRCDTKPATPRGLHLHHLASWESAPELRLEPANIATLCGGCHRWVHGPANLEREWIHDNPSRSSSPST